MPNNISVKYTTIDGIVTERGLESADVDLDRFEINKGETLTIPAGHSVEVRDFESWTRIHCPHEVVVDGPLRYATPEPRDFSPAPSVLIGDEGTSAFCGIGAAFAFFSFAATIVEANIIPPLGYFFLFTFVSFGFGASVGYAITRIVNSLYRKKNPTPTASQLVGKINVAFEEGSTAT